MWLLDVEDQRLHEFYGEKIPPYAILSHTWGDQEVSFADIQKLHRSEDNLWIERHERVEKWHTATMEGGMGQDIEEFDSLAGFLRPNLEAQMVEAKNPSGMDKIRKSCGRAKADGHEYIWVDTCCIDKSSSAQLQEAINSMWNYYKDSVVCYAYLQDVEASSFEDSIASSRWFTRGWTLQELIAPKNVVFVDKNFDTIGTKESLRSAIFDITGIHDGVLKGQDPAELSIAQRMSWAAKRRTTRVEDLAYCLLGIFNVQLPMLYGEGENAFRRLQEEILKVSNDQSILAWQHESLGVDDLATLFASSPKDFAHAGSIVPTLSSEDRLPHAETHYDHGYDRWNSPPLYSLANSGLNIQLPILDFHTGDELEPLAGDDPDQPYPKYTGENEHLYVGILKCQYQHNFSPTIGILLQPTENSQRFVRHHRLARLPVGRVTDKHKRSIFIVGQLGGVVSRPLGANNVNAYQHCVVTTLMLDKYGYSMRDPAAASELASEWEWSRGMEMLTFKGDTASTKWKTEICFTNADTKGDFTVCICFGQPVPGQDVAALWGVGIDGTFGKERRSCVQIERWRYGVIAHHLILVPEVVDGKSRDVALRISAGLFQYHVFGSRLCTLRIAMSEWTGSMEAVAHPPDWCANNWVYHVGSCP